MTQLVYLNGSLVPVNQPGISVFDYGFLYGYSLFETMRAYQGRAFAADKHIERLSRSAEILKIPLDSAPLKEAIGDTIRANNLNDARVRLTVSIGEGGMVPDPASCGKPTVLIIAGDYQPYPDEVYQKGFSAVVSSIRRNSQSPLSRLKSANYLESMLAKQEAREAGVDEAVCLNEKGYIAEASMSNLFIVVGKTLKTPGVASGILPGITRDIVRELATEMGIEIVEEKIKKEEFYTADEAFLTNSLIEIMPLTEIAGKAIGSGKAGPVTESLAGAYRKLVKSRAQ